MKWMFQRNGEKDWIGSLKKKSIYINCMVCTSLILHTFFNFPQLNIFAAKSIYID